MLLRLENMLMQALISRGEFSQQLTRHIELARIRDSFEFVISVAALVITGGPTIAQAHAATQWAPDHQASVMQQMKQDLSCRSQHYIGPPCEVCARFIIFYTPMSDIVSVDHHF